MLVRMRRPPYLLVLVAAIAFPAAGIRAEDAPRPPKGRGDGFHFSPPDEPTTSPATPAPSPAMGESARPEPLTEGDLLVKRLGTWPSPDGIRAAESLVLMGDASVTIALEALTRGDVAVRPGAAWVLGK